MNSDILSDIVNHYQRVICTSPYFNSPQPVRDQSLLYPPFKDLLNKSIKEFLNKFPGVLVKVDETYRADSLQNKYYKSGASKIKDVGTHGMGLAADVDVPWKYQTAIRNIFKKNGLYLLGNWDLRHVQYIPVNQQETVRNAIKNACTLKTYGNLPKVPVMTSKQESSINPILIIVIAGVIVTLILTQD